MIFIITKRKKVDRLLIIAIGANNDFCQEPLVIQWVSTIHWVKPITAFQPMVQIESPLVPLATYGSFVNNTALAISVIDEKLPLNVVFANYGNHLCYCRQRIENRTVGAFDTICADALPMKVARHHWRFIGSVFDQDWTNIVNPQFLLPILKSKLYLVDHKWRCIIFCIADRSPLTVMDRHWRLWMAIDTNESALMVFLSINGDSTKFCSPLVIHCH